MHLRCPIARNNKTQNERFSRLMLMCFNKLIDRPTERKTGRHANWSARRQLHRQTDTLIDRPVCYSKRHPWLPSNAGHYRTSRAAVNRTTGRSLHRLVKVEWELQTGCMRRCSTSTIEDSCGCSNGNTEEISEMGWSEYVLSQAHRHHLEPD